MVAILEYGLSGYNLTGRKCQKSKVDNIVVYLPIIYEHL